QIISDTQKRIQGAHGAALATWQDTEGVVEIRRLTSRQTHAVGIRSGQSCSHFRITSLSIVEQPSCPARRPFPTWLAPAGLPTHCTGNARSCEGWLAR